MKDIFIAISSYGDSSEAGFGSEGLAKKLGVNESKIEDGKRLVIYNKGYDIYRLSFHDWMMEMEELEFESITNISKNMLFGDDYEIPIREIFNKLEDCEEKAEWINLLGLGKVNITEDISNIDLDKIIQEG